MFRHSCHFKIMSKDVLMSNKPTQTETQRITANILLQPLCCVPPCVEASPSAGGGGSETADETSSHPAATHKTSIRSNQPAGAASLPRCISPSGRVTYFTIKSRPEDGATVCLSPSKPSHLLLSAGWRKVRKSSTYHQCLVIIIYCCFYHHNLNMFYSLTSPQTRHSTQTTTNETRPSGRRKRKRRRKVGTQLVLVFRRSCWR